MRYFEQFPLINYNGIMMRDIIHRAKFVKEVLNNDKAFYPFVVSEGQRADMIADKYYGSSDYEWLVWLSNDILDPYFGWVLSRNDFDDYIVSKYGSFENCLETIVHYVYNDTVDPEDNERDYRANYEMTVETYGFLSTLDKSFWKPVYAYEWEFQKNEDKRNIKLLDKRLVPQIERELIGIF
jgi:hypothetical protein